MVITASFALQVLKAHLFLFGIAAVVASAAASGQADATSPCAIFPDATMWLGFDNVYTGKVVEVTYLPEGAAGQHPENDVRIDFELEHVLKGYPERTSWQYHVPSETYCPGGFCVKGADHYALGSEVFYITDDDGNLVSDGACGIGTSKVGDGDYWTLPDEFFDLFEDIYGFPPPKDDPCPDGHVLVTRGAEEFACVRPSTAEKEGWASFDLREYQSRKSGGQVAYDYPLPSETTTVINGETYSEVRVILSNLPRVGETAEIAMAYTHLHEYSDITPRELKRVTIPPNFEFAGMEEENVDVVTSRSGRTLYTAYSEPFTPLGRGQTDSMSATIRAVSEGPAWIGAGAVYDADGHPSFLAARYSVVVGEDRTLLVKDYIRVNNPMPDMSALEATALPAGVQGYGMLAIAGAAAGAAAIFFVRGRRGRHAAMGRR